MKKFLFLCTALALVSPSAYAQFELNDEEISGGKGVLSLTDGIVLDKEKKPEEPKAEETPKAEDNEDKGIFSFMDFSFLKKDETDRFAERAQRNFCSAHYPSGRRGRCRCAVESWLYVPLRGRRCSGRL